MIRVNDFDLNIVVYPYFITGYEQRRTHRKKRINKKWAKIYGDKPIYDAEHIYITEGTIFMSPTCYKKFKEVCDASK